MKTENQFSQESNAGSKIPKLNYMEALGLIRIFDNIKTPCVGKLDVEAANSGLEFNINQVYSGRERVIIVLSKLTDENRNEHFLTLSAKLEKGNLSGKNLSTIRDNVGQLVNSFLTVGDSQVSPGHFVEVIKNTQELSSLKRRTVLEVKGKGTLKREINVDLEIGLISKHEVSEIIANNKNLGNTTDNETDTKADSKTHDVAGNYIVLSPEKNPNDASDNINSESGQKSSDDGETIGKSPKAEEPVEAQFRLIDEPTSGAVSGEPGASTNKEDHPSATITSSNTIDGQPSTFTATFTVNLGNTAPAMQPETPPTENTSTPAQGEVPNAASEPVPAVPLPPVSVELPRQESVLRSSVKIAIRALLIVAGSTLSFFKLYVNNIDYSQAQSKFNTSMISMYNDMLHYAPMSFFKLNVMTDQESYALYGVGVGLVLVGLLAFRKKKK